MIGKMPGMRLVLVLWIVSVAAFADEVDRLIEEEMQN